MKKGEKPHIGEGKVEPVEGKPFPHKDLLKSNEKRLLAVLAAAPESTGDAVEDTAAVDQDEDDD